MKTNILYTLGLLLMVNLGTLWVMQDGEQEIFISEGEVLDNFSANPYIGEVLLFAGNFAPAGWAFCDGQLLSINNNQALFSLLGTTYGGDGETTFGLPDLRGRVPVQPGTGSGLRTVNWGQKEGQSLANLGVFNLPEHNHFATGSLVLGNPGDNVELGDSKWLSSNSGSNNIFISDTTSTSLYQETQNITLSQAGGGQAFGISQPSLGVNYIIALAGVFPSRS